MCPVNANPHPPHLSQLTPLNRHLQCPLDVPRGLAVPCPPRQQVRVSLRHHIVAESVELALLEEHAGDLVDVAATALVGTGGGGGGGGTGVGGERGGERGWVKGGEAERWMAMGVARRGERKGSMICHIVPITTVPPTPTHASHHIISPPHPTDPPIPHPMAASICPSASRCLACAKCVLLSRMRSLPSATAIALPHSPAAAYSSISLDHSPA